MDRIEIYDTTLRDGAQGLGVAFSLVDKLQITEHLDALGVDFIEGGYPLSNPKDAEYFKAAREMALKHTQVCAFGMTRRKGTVAAEDAGMKALVESGAPVITLVGKTWDLHVKEVLRVSLEENLEMIRDSVSFCRESGARVFYDAEHFFDGLEANEDYAIATLEAALDGGAERLVLCDTNGGSLPRWIRDAVRRVSDRLGDRVSGRLGIHTHNDSGLATANALAAVDAGCMQVQGTINGIGERCGNVDLTTVVANLKLKMGRDCLHEDALQRLTETSRFVYGVANLTPVVGQPFVGQAAFAHKGGMHVHAVQRAAHSYEHVKPESVGNERRVLVSELSGASNIAATLGRKFDIESDRELQRKLLERVQDLEHQGYEFEAAMASFELILRELMSARPQYWLLDHYRCSILKTDHTTPTTEAIVKMQVGDAMEYRVADGDGPVNALDAAMRKCLHPHFEQIDRLHLRDYKVRVVNARAESAAKVRVIAQFASMDEAGDRPEHTFGTIGVSENIVDASWQALDDALTYHLLEAGVPSTTRASVEAQAAT